MKRKRFSEEQTICVLKEGEAGAKVDDICRRHGISTATFCNEPLMRHWSEHNGEFRSDAGYVGAEGPPGKTLVGRWRSAKPWAFL
ncbi:transposase [Rhodovulum sulfidophilum]|uniref:transposase n=1 Tax=Rhodovulum sulfidophilum TaxID=35806 RepID=UPI003B75BC9A